MAFKFVALFALIASCSAGILDGQHRTYSDAPSVSYSSISTPVGHGSHSYSAPSLVEYAAPAYKVAAPVTYKVATPVYAKIAHHEEPTAPAHYEFSYGVEDPHTGDVKSQHETRDGDVTKGSYSLIEADGTKRIVEYTVDAHSGFNAVVHREPAQGHVKTVAKVASPVYAAPAYKVAAPVYAAPAYKVAAPVYPGHLSYSAPIVAKAPVPAFTKVSYSSAPEVSYSSVSAPHHH